MQASRISRCPVAGFFAGVQSSAEAARGPPRAEPDPAPSGRPVHLAHRPPLRRVRIGLFGSCQTISPPSMVRKTLVFSMASTGTVMTFWSGHDQVRQHADLDRARVEVHLVGRAERVHLERIQPGEVLLVVEGPLVLEGGVGRRYSRVIPSRSGAREQRVTGQSLPPARTAPPWRGWGRVDRSHHARVEVALDVVDRVGVAAGPVQRHVRDDPSGPKRCMSLRRHELQVGDRVAGVPAPVGVRPPRSCPARHGPSGCRASGCGSTTCLVERDEAGPRVGARRILASQGARQPDRVLGRSDVDVVGLEERGRLRRELGDPVAADLHRVDVDLARAVRAGVAVVRGLAAFNPSMIPWITAGSFSPRTSSTLIAWLTRIGQSAVVGDTLPCRQIVEDDRPGAGRT